MAVCERDKREIRAIRRNEETRRLWRAINRSKGKPYCLGISKIDIKIDEEWTTVTDRATVEAAIIANNSKRFSLTNHTPLMSPHAVSTIGYLAEKSTAQGILQSNFNADPNFDDFTNTFLSYISTNSSLPPIIGEVTQDDYTYCW